MNQPGTTFPTGPKIADVTVKAWLINLVAVPVTIVVVAGALVGTLLLPHAVPVHLIDVVWALAGIVLMMAAHELLHALALMRVARMPWSAFKFGFYWRQLVVYCHCREPVNVKAQRYCALAPLATIGPVTILATLIYPALWLALVTSVHIAGCIGDVWIFLRMRRFAADCFYVDSPDKIGGAVFEPLPKPSLAVNPGAAL